ncbi:MAG: type 4a pilus biogenesis protein PilO [Acidobacteriales bacterium]|nr:type 4a pilus biogenesis protein PilO [Terriglobales bacterium]
MFSDWPGWKQWIVLLFGGVLLTGALYFTVFKSQREKNLAAQARLDAVLRENAELLSYRPRLAELDRAVADLNQRMEIENRIVPSQKEAEGLIRVLGVEAQKAGIAVRRYTARPPAPKEFYTEVPFELELDGPYYPMLNFFDRVSRMERIVNVSELMLATTQKPSDAKAKRQYKYGAQESVVATCTATTFFSHDRIEPPASPGKGKAAGGKK